MEGRWGKKSWFDKGVCNTICVHKQSRQTVTEESALIVLIAVPVLDHRYPAYAKASISRKQNPPTTAPMMIAVLRRTKTKRKGRTRDEGKGRVVESNGR